MGGVTKVQEDYLEAIAELSADGSGARVGAIARRVGVHKSTVTAALRVLSAKGLVAHEPYGTATLLPAGRRLAGEVCRSHRVLRRFLRDILGLDSAVADANACRLEHAIDRSSLDRLLLFVDFTQEAGPCPDLASAFSAYRRSRRGRAALGKGAESPA
ncbi:MAG: metal-dependent transcriptional regulator [Lentisphaeria bacterium]|nr:metal-dependent transcriptional regulator [Lentisphaeria bacterium]